MPKKQNNIVEIPMACIFFCLLLLALLAASPPRIPPSLLSAPFTASVTAATDHYENRTIFGGMGRQQRRKHIRRLSLRDLGTENAKSIETTGTTTGLEGRESRSHRPRERLVLFLHMHKAGGTTVVNYMRRLGLMDPRMVNRLTGKDPYGFWDGEAATAEREGGGGGDVIPRASQLQIISSTAATAYNRSRAANKEFWLSLYEAGADFVVLEYNFLQPWQYSMVREAFDSVVIFRRPWDRFRSTYERELYMLCKPRPHRIGEREFKKEGYHDNCVEKNTMARMIFSKHGGLNPNREDVWGGILRPNYYIRMLNGMNDRADLNITKKHLEKAKMVASMFDLILVLEDSDEEKEGLLEDFFWRNDNGDTPLPHDSNNGLKEDTQYEAIRSKSEQMGRPLFDERNALDEELYRFIRDLSLKRRGRDEEEQSLLRRLSGAPA